jgi:hypothetical protein
MKFLNMVCCTATGLWHKIQISLTTSICNIYGDNTLSCIRGFAWIKRGVFGSDDQFIGSLYNWLQQFTNHYLTLSPSSDWTLHWNYSDFQLNWTTLLRCAPSYSFVSQSQSYVMTDCQSASLSWCQAPIWGLRSDSFLTVAGLMWGALSDERMGLLLCTTLIIPRHGKNRLLLSRMRVYWSVT